MDKIRQISDGEISIVPQVRAHADEMYLVLANPELNKFTDDEPPESASWLAERYQKLETRTSADGSELWLNWVVRLERTNDLIGYTQATIDKDTADVAWVIGVSSQGKGYATKASRLMMAELEYLGVVLYTCHIKPNHAASNRVAEKLGFHPTEEVEDGEVVWARKKI